MIKDLIYLLTLLRLPRFQVYLWIWIYYYHLSIGLCNIYRIILLKYTGSYSKFLLVILLSGCFFNTMILLFQRHGLIHLKFLLDSMMFLLYLLIYLFRTSVLIKTSIYSNFGLLFHSSRESQSIPLIFDKLIIVHLISPPFSFQT